MDKGAAKTNRREISESTRISLTAAVLFIAAAVVIVVLVNRDMKELALAGAVSETRHYLDHNLAIHSYFNHQLKPTLFELVDSYDTEDRFDPIWMSSTFAVREIAKYTEALNDAEYYYKECAINARSPENEADEYERAFIELINTDPSVIEQTEVRELAGAQYLVTLRRGEVMEQTCLRCHSTPDQAPAGMVEIYGSTRSFDRHAEEVVSAISVRVPLSEAFKHADRFSIQLSALLLLILLMLFVAQHMLSKQMMYTPLAAIQGKAVEIAGDVERLGDSVPVPPRGELRKLALAFNVMSASLRDEHEKLEQRVSDRTAELLQTNLQLEEEIRERRHIEEDLLRSKNVTHALLNAPLDTALLLAPDGTVLAANDQACRRYGLELADFTGRIIYDLLDLENAAKRRAAVQQVLASGAWLQFEDERAGLTYEYNVYPILDVDGSVSQVAVFGRDVTDRRRATDAVRNAELREAELAAIRMTAATSAHEVNNPLQGITGTLQLLKDSVDGADNLQMIDDALKAAMRIRQVIGKMERLEDPQYRSYSKGKKILDLEAPEPD